MQLKETCKTKQLNVGMNHNHPLSTKILINMIANRVMIHGFTHKNITDFLTTTQNMLVALRGPDILRIDCNKSYLSKYMSII